MTGVRRSWETDRSRAVFISSLRRRASVSTTSSCSASRCRRRRGSSRAAARRARAPARDLPPRPSREVRARRPLPRRHSGTARPRPPGGLPARGGSGPLRAERLRQPLAPPGRARLRAAPLRAAAGPARSPGPPRGGARPAHAREHGRDRRRGRPRRRQRRTPPARPSRGRGASVKSPDRRQVEEVEGSGAEHGRCDTEAETPEDRHHDHRQQVDHAERLDGRDVLERVDEQRRERDRDEQHERHRARARDARRAARSASGRGCASLKMPADGRASRARAAPPGSPSR